MLAQLMRFAGVGGLATAVHVLVALAVQAAFPVSDQGANLSGFAAAVLLSYLGHARFTFAVTSQSVPQFMRFFSLSCLSLGISSLTVWLITAKLGFSFIVAMVAVSVVVPIASYLVMRFWVFDEA
ncbi:MAG: GtrA family protein [Rhodobacteraceae bacterium]|nr:GtrA family protein [Paracoccaceae bacterium]